MYGMNRNRHPNGNRQQPVMPLQPIDLPDGLAGYVRISPTTNQMPQPIFLVVAIFPQAGKPSVPRVVGRLMLRGMRRSRMPGDLSQVTEPYLGQAQPAVAAPTAGLPAGMRYLQSGVSYKITSEPWRNILTEAMASKLENIMESFASQRGGTSENPLPFGLSRGYQKNDKGHGGGRAADISTIGGKSLLTWFIEMEDARKHARAINDPAQSIKILEEEKARNLAYQFYNYLLEIGGWRRYADRPDGVVQLFGPWTDILGPWKRLPETAPIAARSSQEKIFSQHNNHIHVSI